MNNKQLNTDREDDEWFEEKSWPELSFPLGMVDIDELNRVLPDDIRFRVETEHGRFVKRERRINPQSQNQTNE